MANNGDPETPQSRLLTDDLGRHFAWSDPVQRVVSLCPSQTETLIALGIPVVGRTRYCIHPKETVKQIPEVGGTKKADFEAVRRLEPDLIVCEKEENTPEMVAELEKIAPVAVTDVRDIASCTHMIRFLGHLGTAESAAKAQMIASTIEKGFASLTENLPVEPVQPSVAYLIWRKPWMAAGGNTFIHSVLQAVGFQNVFADVSVRYPQFELEALAERKPKLILLSSEPYPFATQHIDEVRRLLPESNLYLVNGEHFSWYGVRMVEAVLALAEWRKSLDIRQ
jgi:iron complex transport system substrate-binding protein